MVVFVGVHVQVNVQSSQGSVVEMHMSKENTSTPTRWQVPVETLTTPGEDMDSVSWWKRGRRR